MLKSAAFDDNESRSLPDYLRRSTVQGEFTYIAGDLVDVLAMHELGRHGHVDQLALGIVVLLSVAQLGLDRKNKTSYAYLFC